MNMYYYPKLSNTDLGFIRLGGPGLANCMFMAAQAWIAAGCDETRYITPTWLKFSIGPYIRRERDKRNYANLFKSRGISGIKKALTILNIKLGGGKCLYFNTLGNYFSNINQYQPQVKKYFESIINPEIITSVDGSDLRECVAVHVRLGDYVPSLRIPISWYVGILRNITKINPKQRIILFSDGSDAELADLLVMPGVERRFYGNAIADIWAISKCKLLIGSDSTFSAWGAFLGNVPIIFSKRHFPTVYDGRQLEVVLGESMEIPSSFHNSITPAKDSNA